MADAGVAELEGAAELLRSTNSQLQRQLAEFSEALQKSVAPSSPRAAEPPVDREMERRLAEKQRQLAAAQRRLEAIKRANTELRKKVHQAEDSSRAATLEREIAELSERAAALQRENRELVQRARGRAKQIQQQENMKEEWPQKLASALADLRVGRDRLARFRAEEERRGAQVQQQKERLRKLSADNHELEARLGPAAAASARGGGGSRSASGSRARKRSSDEDLQELAARIEALEKEKRQDRARQARNIAHTEAELEEAKKELVDCEARLKEKDKEVRMQHLQVKKLKRALRELALGAGPAPVPPRKGGEWH